jgi:capsular polysaccharide biosynthesis protein
LRADTIIIPTATSETVPTYSNTIYYTDFLLKYIREKMLAGVAKMNIQMIFPEKIFISRKDGGAARKIPNEDEVFALFEPLGYKRFELSKLSMAEKIAMMNHAKRIISFMGSGSTNVLFASPDVKFYEIFQSWIEPTFYFIAKALGFEYDCLDASTIDDLLQGNCGSFGRMLSLDLVQEFINNHPEL